MATKGFIKTFGGERLLPITRGELVLDKDGNIALTSQYFESGNNGNNYGLISATELNAIRNSLGLGSSGSQGNSLSDVYTKLSYINSGLKVNGTPLNFYNTGGTQIETNIQSVDQNAILIGLANNVLSIGLKEFSEIDKTATNQIIKGIKIDKYGRVSEVTQNWLNNNEIPPTLTGKLLNESTASDIPTGSTNGALIANKKYVDSQIGDIKSIATGALKFVGSIHPDNFDAINSNLSLKEGYYYKVSSEFDIPNYLLGIQGSNQNTRVKIGDTLIIHNGYFIHIPSGDDITSISIQNLKNNVATNILSAAIGSILFKFTEAFNVVSNETNKVDIDIQTASITNNIYQKGVLSESDYRAFIALKQSSSNVSYAPSLTTGEHLGILTINGDDHDLYYLNHQYELKVKQNNNLDENPILNFIDNYNGNHNIIIKSAHKGISIKKSGEDIEFYSNYKIDNASKNYLEFKNDTDLNVQLGSFDINANITTEGLVNTTILQDYVGAFATHFEPIYKSLISTNPDPDSKYQYGNEALVTAITLTI